MLTRAKNVKHVFVTMLITFLLISLGWYWVAREDFSYETLQSRKTKSSGLSLDVLLQHETCHGSSHVLLL